MKEKVLAEEYAKIPYRRPVGQIISGVENNALCSSADSLFDIWIDDGDYE